MSRHSSAPDGGRWGPLAGLLAGAALGASVFLLALLVHGRWFADRPGGSPPAGFAAAGDPGVPVDILATLPGPGPQAALLPLREDGADSSGEAAVLDEALFPGGPPRRWARLLVSNPGECAPFPLSLAGGALRLVLPAGPVGNEDLAAAFEARRGALSPHRVLDLHVQGVPERERTVAAGESARLLLAFPPGTDPAAALEMELPGGIRLRPRKAAPESLRAALLDGDVASIPEASPAEASAGAGGGTGERR